MSSHRIRSLFSPRRDANLLKDSSDIPNPSIIKVFIRRTSARQHLLYFPVLGQCIPQSVSPRTVDLNGSGTISKQKNFALPMYQITRQCEYYAIRLPLLRAGLRRLPFIVSLPPKVFTHPFLNVHPPGADDTAAESRIGAEIQENAKQMKPMEYRNVLIWARPVKTVATIKQILQRNLDEAAIELGRIKSTVHSGRPERSDELLHHLKGIQDVFYSDFDTLQTQLLIRPINDFQRYNHWPGSASMIGDKKGLQKNIEKNARRLQSAFRDKSACSKTGAESLPFLIPTYCLPQDKNKLRRILQRIPKDANHSTQWIVKPARGSCGRGIFICQSDDSRLCKLTGHSKGHSSSSHSNGDQETVVQKYIANPLLYNSYKFDMRLYVLVTSLDPFVCYKFTEGMVRFAAEPYNAFPSSTQGGCEEKVRLGEVAMEKYSQLTNYSIGRKYQQKICNFLQPFSESQLLVEDLPEPWKPRLKMPLSDFKKWLEEILPGKSRGYTTLDNKINDLIIATLLSTRRKLLAEMRHENAFWKGTRSSLHSSNQLTFASWSARWKSLFSEVRDVLPSKRGESSIDLQEIQSMQPLQRYIDSFCEKRPSVRLNKACFELYGFDIMIDKNYNPLLIEVNVLPSLESSSGMDYDLKNAVLTDLLNIMCFECDPKPLSKVCRFKAENSCPGENGFQCIFPTQSMLHRFRHCFHKRERESHRRFGEILKQVR